MLDFLFGVGQVLSLVALVCGFVLTIVYRDCKGEAPLQGPRTEFR